MWNDVDNFLTMVGTATDGDTTPTVLGITQLTTANSMASTITTFDDGVVGQQVTVDINDAYTTFDFTGTTLKGNGGRDWLATNGDTLTALYDGTNWLCTCNRNVVPVPQTLTGAGAVSIATDVTWLVTTAADALTLADGTENQHKYIVMKTDGGAGTLTPTSLGNGSTITFDDVGDSAHLIFTNSAWHLVGGTATLA